MDKAKAAEWILRWAVISERASELVGDQLEVHSTNTLRFWLQIAWLMFVFTWRTLAGIVVAAYAGIFLPSIPFGWVMARWSAAGHPLTLEVRSISVYILVLSMLFWAEAAFSAIRFGLRSNLSKLSIIGALLSTTAGCFWWLPYAPQYLLVITICVACFHLTSAARRQALGVWLAALSLGWIAMYLLFRVQRTLSLGHTGHVSWPFILALNFVPATPAVVSLYLVKRRSEFSELEATQY